MDKPLLSRKEAAGHSKACEAGLVGVLTALSRATEALPLSQRETYVGELLTRKPHELSGAGLYIC